MLFIPHLHCVSRALWLLLHAWRFLRDGSKAGTQHCVGKALMISVLHDGMLNDGNEHEGRRSCAEVAEA
jgi:hypothetical protein